MLFPVLFTAAVAFAAEPFCDITASVISAVLFVSVFSSTASLLYHMGRIFQEQRPQPVAGIQAAVDSKLKRKIREKKIAMGHKLDDHEEQGPAMYS